MSVGEAGAAPALGRRPTEPGTVTGTPRRRPWHPLPARRASPASPPGSGGPPSAGMAMPLLRARAAQPGSHGDPGSFVRPSVANSSPQPAAAQGLGPRFDRTGRGGWGGVAYTAAPPWWSFVKLAADDPRASNAKREWRRGSAPTLPWIGANSAVAKHGLWPDPHVRPPRRTPRPVARACGRPPASCARGG